jgi:hypothetical protein
MAALVQCWWAVVAWWWAMLVVLGCDWCIVVVAGVVTWLFWCIAVVVGVMQLHCFVVVDSGW